MKSLLTKIGIAVAGAAIVLVAGSAKTYPESAKMAALIVLVLGIFLAILDERLLREGHPKRKKER